MAAVRAMEAQGWYSRGTVWTLRALVWTGVSWWLGWRAAGLLLTLAAVTAASAVAVHRLADGRSRQTAAWTGVALLATALVGAIGWPTASWSMTMGAGVVVCHGVALLLDTARRRATPTWWTALAYVGQCPALPAGPLSRYADFATAWQAPDVSIASVGFGTRRLATGLVKLTLVAAPLIDLVTTLTTQRLTRLSADAAWLAAIAGALASYVWLSGCADLSIGWGRLVGLRYVENVRRPYTAPSWGEFWRRWNISLIAWGRAYGGWPADGAPLSFRGLAALLAGAGLAGCWQRGDWRAAVVWAVYVTLLLVLESVGWHSVLMRGGRAVAHAWMLLTLTVGGVLLWAPGPGPALGLVEAMSGQALVHRWTVLHYLTVGNTAALLLALLSAGPLVPSISRWRVSVDAATTSVIMMSAATGVLLWQWVWRVVAGGPRRGGPRESR